MIRAACAPTTPGQVARACAQATRPVPPFNIGISCGPSGLVVIDLDIPKEGGQLGGPESFRRLCQGHRRQVAEPRPGTPDVPLSRSPRVVIRVPSGAG